MRDAVTFTFTLVASLVAAIAANLGWRPPIAFAWDPPALLVLTVGCALLAGCAGNGLGNMLPRKWIPARLRFAPSLVGLFAPMFAGLGAVNISNQSTPTEVAWAIGTAAGWGAIFGCLMGLVSISDSKRATEPYERRQARLTIAIGALAIGVVTLLAIPRPEDKPKFTYYQTYNSGDACLEVGVSSSFMGKLGILRISRGEQVNAAVLGEDQWNRTAGIIEKAARMQSDAWSVAGEIRDGTPGDSTRLVISGGPGVRFEETSPHSDSMSFDLPANDVSSLQDVVGRIAKELSAP